MLNSLRYVNRFDFFRLSPRWFDLKRVGKCRQKEAIISRGGGGIGGEEGEYIFPVSDPTELLISFHVSVAGMNILPGDNVSITYFSFHTYFQKITEETVLKNLFNYKIYK